MALIILSLPIITRGRNGDVFHISSHQQVKVITDPTKGYNAYPSWAIFPGREVEYRKAVLFITYACPDGQHCGEWDYIDNVFLRRAGGSSAKALNLELARIISPYGWRFDSTWQFTWHVDLTDFSFFLHDSVEIEFVHGGYESNTDRGWLVTLDFMLVEGKPAMEFLSLDTLWCGSFAYGDSSQPIEESLVPISFHAPERAEWARLRILQTGHGMDDFENCAEFCSKYRSLYLNDSLIDQRQIWRECGHNPLYPQAGTWLFDRAGWCPGALVIPDIYNLRVEPNSDNFIQIVMQPYHNPQNPSANYSLTSYLFYYNSPRAKHDVSLEEIIVPSTCDEYARENPACIASRILIKNNGSEILNSLVVKYGITSSEMKTYDWDGVLASCESMELTLPMASAVLPDTGEFIVRLDSPNGRPDEYPEDNQLSSAMLPLPIHGTPLVFAFRSNHDSAHNFYRLLNQQGEVILERRLGTINALTTYYDTLALASGCYELEIIDTAGDGLEFWFNPESGSGYARLLDMAGHLVKNFPADFGSGIRYAFQVKVGMESPLSNEELPLVNPFPPLNDGHFELELFFNEPGAARITILAQEGDLIVYDSSYQELKQVFLPIDISSQPEGVYIVKVIAGEGEVKRRIRIKHNR